MGEKTLWARRRKGSGGAAEDRVIESLKRFDSKALSRKPPKKEEKETAEGGWKPRANVKNSDGRRDEVAGRYLLPEKKPSHWGKEKKEWQA